MRWIYLKGTVPERMLQYVEAMRLKEQGEDIGVVSCGKWIGDIFQNLPKCCVIRKQSFAESLKAKLLKIDIADDINSWMNYENVECFEESIADIFTLDVEYRPQAYSDIISKLKDGESVAVHVFSPNKKSSICTPDYYNWSISGMTNWIDNPHFVVVTDDMKWAKQNIIVSGADWVYLPSRHHKLIFDALRYAKHNIICDELTSWWGAWLNRNQDKIISAPKEWGKTNGCQKLLPLYWTLVATK